MTLLDIKKIRLDCGTQHREKINDEAVEEYCSAMLDGAKFPPVEVVLDGTTYVLWDGFHRVHGARQAGFAAITVNITKGTLRDAITLSLSANATNGLRRTLQTKRNAVIAALQDTEYAKLSDRAIAKHCLVSHVLVASLRRPEKTTLAVENGSSSTAELYGNTSGNDDAPEENTDDSGPDSSQDNSKRKRGRPSKKKAKPEVDDPEPDDPESAPAPPPKARVVPLGSIEMITRERDELRDKVIELGQMCEELTDEVAALLAITSTDDQVTAALEECRKERALRRIAEERINGLMNEKNAAVRAANGWQRKARKA